MCAPKTLTPQGRGWEIASSQQRIYKRGSLSAVLTGEPERPRKTITATFRVTERIYDALQKEAENQDTSLNTLVNQLLDIHVDEEVYLSRVGYLRVAKPTFRRILEGSTEEAIVQAARSSGKETCTSITLARRGTLTRETVLQSLHMFAEFGGFAHYSEIEVHGKPVIVLMHDFGPKGSLFICNFAKGAFESMDLQPEVSVGERSVVIEF